MRKRNNRGDNNREPSRSNRGGRANSDGPAARISGYVGWQEKDWWNEEMARVAKLDGLRSASMGTLLSRISKFRLRLDLASIREYPKTHSGHVRDKDPAR